MHKNNGQENRPLSKILYSITPSYFITVPSPVIPPLIKGDSLSSTPSSIPKVNVPLFCIAVPE